jgi:hypothetical protein
MRSLLPLAKPATQIVREFRFPEVMVRPSLFVQLMKTKPALGAFALVFAVISAESPEFDPTFCPFVSPVPDCVAPAPVEQFVEPVKPWAVKPKFIPADFTLMLPSVNVVATPDWAPVAVTS